MRKKKDTIPDNTIALFVDKFEDENMYDRSAALFVKPSRHRDEDLFPGSKHCKPLVLANQLGYNLVLSYGFNVIWNGGMGIQDLHITFIANDKSDSDVATVMSNFGGGIVTISINPMLRTPPGINTLILPPINQIMPNATVLSGTVETDQTNHRFTFNIKINEPNIVTSFPAGTPLATIIPIERYFIEKFEIKDAEKLVSEELYIETLNKTNDSALSRNFSKETARLENRGDGFDFHYLRGMDFDETQYPEYQSQSGKRIVR